MKDIKLAAMDIDGTLLDSKSRLHENVKRTVDAVCASDKELVISTGRTMSEMKMIFSVWPQIRYHILSNGAYIYDAKEKSVIYRDPVSAETLVRIYAIAQKYKVMMEVFAGGEIYTERKCWENTDYYNARFLFDRLPGSRTVIESVGQFVKERKEPADKINLFFHDFSDCARVIDESAALGVTAVISADKGLEFNNVGTCKGKALCALCERLGVEIGQAMAMGDGQSDISMLKAAGLSVAPANASDEVKAYATHIAPDCDEEGAVWALEKFVLI